MASTAICSLPVPVYMITGTSGHRSFTCFSKVRPSLKRSW